MHVCTQVCVLKYIGVCVLSILVCMCEYIGVCVSGILGCVCEYTGVLCVCWYVCVNISFHVVLLHFFKIILNAMCFNAISKWTSISMPFLNGNKPF